MTAPAPLSPTSSLMRVGGGLPFARPTEMLMFSTSVVPAEFAGLLIIRIRIGSEPVALGPVQVAESPLVLMILSAPDPVTQRSMWLVAPGDPGAPFTYG